MKTTGRLSKYLALFGILGATVAGATAPVWAFNETRLIANLRGPAIRGVVPSGVAEFRERPGEREFRTQVSNVNLPQGTKLTVAVNGTVLGTIIVTSSHGVGGGDLDLKTQDGEFVPSLREGDVVTVSAGAAVILSGTLRRN